MKTLALLLFGIFISNINAQTEAEMQAWTEYMTPSKVHEQMAKSDGEWIGEITMWMAPGAEPMHSQGTSVNQMILGGRYQETFYQSSYQGMPMEGRSILSYDNATKKYKSIWIDNFGTGMMVLEGTSIDGKTIEFKGEMIDPMTGNSLPVREVYTYIDHDTEKMEMYYAVEGKEFQTMEIIFKRKK